MRTLQEVLSCALSLLLVLLPLPASPKQPAGLHPAVFKDLSEAAERPYLELFEEAARLEFRAAQIEQMRCYFDEAESECVHKFKRRAKRLRSELRAAQQELHRRTEKLSDSERHELHCRVQNHRILVTEADTLARSAVPVAYANKLAKLDLIENWPAEARRIQREIDGGAHHKRQWGDVQDIGFREIAPNQEKDVKRGQQAEEELKRLSLMPPILENEAIEQYVRSLAERIAAKSDLRVPVKLTLLDSPEINAFALPGGFLYVNRGLLEATQDESQLVGVLAHEMAHAAARHGHKLMKKATIASILYQAAQVSAMILTGGVVGIGGYYALQYGFYGLGMVLSLQLLGVSREFELEADQLGIQYSWNAGYDPAGFIRFFDKMATEEGYVKGASWFRTHPPFYKRMVEAQQEILFLPKKELYLVHSPAFDEMQQEVKVACAEAEKREEDAPCPPSLYGPEEKDCPAPKTIEYKPGQSIEEVCLAGG